MEKRGLEPPRTEANRFTVCTATNYGTTSPNTPIHGVITAGWSLTTLNRIVLAVRGGLYKTPKTFAKRFYSFRSRHDRNRTGDIFHRNQAREYLLLIICSTTELYAEFYNLFFCLSFPIVAGMSFLHKICDIFTIDVHTYQISGFHRTIVTISTSLFFHVQHHLF